MSINDELNKINDRLTYIENKVEELLSYDEINTEDIEKISNKYDETDANIHALFLQIRWIKDNVGMK